MFNSLVDNLRDYFDKPFTNLPLRRKRRVKKRFFPLRWDNLSPEQRRSLAAQWDGRNDPTLEEERHGWFDHFAQMQDIDQEIKDWELISTPTALDLAEKKKQLTALQRQRHTLAQEMSYPPVLDPNVLALPVNYPPTLDPAKEKIDNPCPSRPTANRDQELQRAANALAKRWRKEGRRRFSKREIVRALAQSDQWKEMTADRIERVLRVKWR